jgi:hypothetical protein
MAKQVTHEQAERKKTQAAAFMERIGEPDRADEFDDMSVEDYAEHRGLELVSNPRRQERKTAMATKSELQDQIDSIGEVLNEAYTPEATRAELAEAVGSALDIINGEDDSDETDDDAGDSDDSEDDDEGE